MSVLLDRASSEYLWYNGAVLTAAPLTMVCKAKLSTGNGVHHTLLSLAYNVSDVNYFYLRVLAPDHGTYPNEVQAFTGSGSGSVFSTSGNSISNQTWFQAGAVYASASSRIAYLNGVPGVENTTGRTPGGINKTGIGVLVRSTLLFYADGDIAEVAFWNAALTTPEMVSLSKGFSPLLIRPQSLAAYWDLTREGASGVYQDRIGGKATVEANGSATSPHPRVILPCKIL